MLRFVTLNMRYDNEQDGIHRFKSRFDRILRKINETQPDVLCMQEVLPSMRSALQTALKGYSFVGHARGENYISDESTPIAIRNETINLHSTRTFWLSPTPSAPASRYPVQSICPRICTLAIMHHAKSNTLLYCYNTHLDHEAAEAQKNGLEQILNNISQEVPSSASVFLMGDFNFTPSAPSYGLWSNASRPLTDLTVDISSSFHNFGRQDPAVKIDYILSDLGSANKPSSVFKWHCDEDGFYSDHDALQLDWCPDEIP